MAYTSEYPFVFLTADVVCFTIHPEHGLAALMVRRGSAPYRGRWALPGGFVDEGEDVELAARRELLEETGLDARSLRLEQIGAYAAPRRDPRHRTVSVAWLTAAPAGPEVSGGDDAADARWLGVDDLLGSSRLAFDHATILSDALERLRANLERTNQAFAFLPHEFTVTQLREVYEVVWGRSLDPGNFQRKVTGAAGLLAETGWQTTGARGRPATLYAGGQSTEISPPLSRLSSP